jgi:Lrp/AsnC family leucine-responsive transcriptional regulator
LLGPMTARFALSLMSVAAYRLQMAHETDDIDQWDRRILAILGDDGRLPVATLADRIGLSRTPTLARLRRLEATGVIRGYRAVIDQARLGRRHVAFVEVKLSDTRDAALADFNAAVRAVPRIEECHMIAGGFDYLLKVRTEDIAAYRRLLGETISALPHVAQTSTYVAMEAVKDLGDVPAPRRG